MNVAFQRLGLHTGHVYVVQGTIPHDWSPPDDLEPSIRFAIICPTVYLYATVRD